MTPSLDRHHWSRPPAAVSRDRHGLGMLPETGCLALLGTQPIGRLGFSAGSLPVIYPVNFFLDDRTIVFRSEGGEKLDAARNRSVACMEVDHIDGFEHGGWSVLATGRMSIASDARAAVLGRLPLAPWALDEPTAFIELSIEMLSGRTIERPAREVAS